MSSLPKLSFLFKTTYRPTGAVYYGVFETSDFSFGTDQYTDPYIGNGRKLIELAKANGNNRRLFHVQVLKVSTRADVEAALKKMLENIDYSNPLVLNSREGYPRGRPQSKEHTANAVAARDTAVIGNKNARGNVGASIDIDMAAGQKLKWCHAADNSEEKMILVNEDNTPVKDLYKGWVVGRMSRNAYVQKRVTEIEAAQKVEEAKESDED